MISKIKSSAYRFAEAIWQALPAQTFQFLPRNQNPSIEIVWPESYSWPQAAGWLEPIREGLQSHFPVRRASIDSPFPGVYHLDFILQGQSYRIAIDIADHTEVNPDQVKYTFAYFKMQFRNGGYDFPNIFPGGFGPASPTIYRYLPYLRHLRDQGNFRYDISGRFGLQFAESVRKKAINILLSQNKITYAGGEKVRYSHSLLEVAQSRICLDLPGNGPLCFRLVDYMAVGACIIAYPHGAELQKRLIDGVHVVYMKEDMSDLLELCEYYVNNSSERERLCQASRLYFEAHLHNKQLANYYLSTLLQLIAGKHI